MRFTKTLLSGVTALALLAGPALAQPAPGQGPGQQQQHGGQGGQPPHGEPQGQQGKPGNMGGPQGHPHGPTGPHGQWARGDYYNGHRHVVPHGDWNRYHLRPPPSGYEWVRSGDQFVMIAITSGIIASIIAGSAYGY
ncbi:RcnB family protein [Acidocella sp.]|uniref:RcnB family protein n=1 Tax=Acidocella sp. TaxID=50710 RepID=UPI003CFE105B